VEMYELESTNQVAMAAGAHGLLAIAFVTPGSHYRRASDSD
jgi:hypothetical protein